MIRLADSLCKHALSLWLLLLCVVFPLPLWLLVVLPWETDVRFGFPETPSSSSKQEQDDEKQEGQPVSHYFLATMADGTTHKLHAWLYVSTEQQSVPPPVIVMASGMAMSKDIGLPTFASAFVKHGYSVFLFDYVGWGLSEGDKPRHLVAPRLHVQDYLAAVRHIQDTNGLGGAVDPSRIILWGTSYSGGHALASASVLGKQISAVIAMEPFTSPWLIVFSVLYLRLCPYSAGIPVQDDTAVITQRGLMEVARLLYWGVLSAVSTAVRGVRILLVAISDALRGSLGLPAAYIPIVASVSQVQARLQQGGLLSVSRAPLSLGVFSDVDFTQMMSAVPVKGPWKNLAAARMIFYYPTYRPLKDAAGIECPVLLIAGRHDELTPEYSIIHQRAAHLLSSLHKDVQVRVLDGTHISLYRAPSLMPTKLHFLKHKVPL